jgi:hypothetical protein
LGFQTIIAHAHPLIREVFPMVATAVICQEHADSLLTPKNEALVARLTRVAYDVALHHTPDQPFTELELALWRELRAAFQAEGGVGQEAQ